MKYLPLTLILLLFLITRLLWINSIPASVYWDEASIGVNANSVLTTGEDEWGQSFPVEFKAFGEYKLPVYIYTAIPFIALFGLNELSIRLPSVVFSLGTVTIMFFLGKYLVDKKEGGFLAAFLMVISPWFFVFSRTGYEAMAGLFFYLLGIYLFLIFRIKSWLIFLATISLILSMYSYNSFRIVAPVTFILLLFFSFYRLKEAKKVLPILLISLVLFLGSYLFIIQSLISGNSSERLKEVGIFEVSVSKPKIVFNIAKNYLYFFTPNFVFDGDKNPRSQLPGSGQIYLIEIPFIFFGLLYVLKSKKPSLFLVLALFLVGFIPASITKEVGHSLRSIASLPMLLLLTMLGIRYLADLLRKGYLYTLIICVFLVSFGWYYFNFLNNFPKYSADWQYPYKAVFTSYKNDFNNYDNVLVTDRLSQPYIFGLFYLNYDLEKFRREAVYNEGNRKETSVIKKFDKFYFSEVDFYNLPKGKSLIFADKSERLTEINHKDVIKNLDGSIALYVYEYEK